MSGDPVSWLMVEPGWTVVDAHGKKIGKVDEVLGDEQVDIFHGLMVDGEEILAERVAEIREGEITLALDGSEVCRASGQATTKRCCASCSGRASTVHSAPPRRWPHAVPPRVSGACHRRECPRPSDEGRRCRSSRAPTSSTELSNKAAAKGGVAAKVAPELADDAAFLRKLKPSLMVKRAKGELPKDAEPGTARAQCAVGARSTRRRRSAARARIRSWSTAAAFGVGTLLAKAIDWRGHAHPRR